MKRVLFVTPYNPFTLPRGAASQSVFYRLVNLSRIAEVHLVTFSFSAPPQEETALPNVFRYFVPYPPYGDENHSLVARMVRLISGRLPLFSRIEVLSGALGRKIRDLAADKTFDLIHIDDVVIGPVAAHCPKDVKKIHFFHNVLTNQYRNIYRGRSNPRTRLASYIEYLHIRRYEGKIFQDIETAVVLTADEAAVAEKLNPRSRIVEVPLEIDTQEYTPAPEKIEENRLVMTGTMSYDPNHEGAVYFIKKILPLIRLEVPAATFWAVGMNPRPELLALKGDRVFITGRVADIKDELNKAAVIVVPLLAGGGMRFKILEAFALAKAVVSTPVGAEGIRYKEGRDILIARSDEDFARQVCGLLKNPDRALSCGENARRLVREKYDRAVVGRQWRHLYEEILGS